jgi:uridine phosphorylase
MNRRFMTSLRPLTNTSWNVAVDGIKCPDVAVGELPSIRHRTKPVSTVNRARTPSGLKDTGTVVVVTRTAVDTLDTKFSYADAEQSARADPAHINPPTRKTANANRFTTPPRGPGYREPEKSSSHNRLDLDFSKSDCMR